MPDPLVELPTPPPDVPLEDFLARLLDELHGEPDLEQRLKAVAAALHAVRDGKKSLAVAHVDRVMKLLEDRIKNKDVFFCMRRACLHQVLGRAVEMLSSASAEQRQDLVLFGAYMINSYEPHSNSRIEHFVDLSRPLWPSDGDRELIKEAATTAYLEVHDIWNCPNLTPHQKKLLYDHFDVPLEDRPKSVQDLDRVGQAPQPSESEDEPPAKRVKNSDEL